SIARNAFADVEQHRHAQRQAVEHDALHVLRDSVVGEREIAGSQPLHRLTSARHRYVELDDLDAALEDTCRLLLRDRIARLKGSRSARKDIARLKGSRSVRKDIARLKGSRSK